MYSTNSTTKFSLNDIIIDATNDNNKNSINHTEINLIETYLHQNDWQVKENANMSYSLQGMRNYINNEITKDYWLEKIYPENIKRAHLGGDLHLHDLGELNSYCVGWDLKDLLIRGFGGVEGKISCHPPKHFGSALGQIVNFFYTLQGESAGAQAFSNFDTLLAPYIYYDKLSYKQVKQYIQSFIYNLNVPTRVGFQTPFTNLTMDLVCPKFLATENVVMGGKLMSEKYSDFAKEMDILNACFAEVMLEGDSNGRVFTFPIPTYNLTKEMDWEDKRLDNIWRMSSKYGIPYFANFLNSDMDPDDARSMCCRLRLDKRELQKRGGGLFGSNPLTGSIGVVTINLPRIGYLSDNLEQLYEILENNMKLAKQSLEIKRKIIEELTEKGLYPYTKVYLNSVKERFGKYWANHFSTIGLVGMNECLLNFAGVNIMSEKGQILAQEILDFMRNKISEYQDETTNLYNLEATPAEGTSYRLALLDKKYYPTIISAAGSQEHSYYTNSSHLPVNFSNNIFDTLNLQDKLQTKYTGGTVLHLYLGEKIDDIELVKKLVKKIATNYHLPYFTLTPTFSICKEHGYLSGENNICPICNQKCEVYSRIVGYLRPVEQWNFGKKQEFMDRKVFEPSFS